MSEIFYPAVSQGFLETAKRVKELVKTPSLFASEHCFYSAEVIEELTALFPVVSPVVSNPVPDILPDEDFDGVTEMGKILETLAEVEALRNDLKDSHQVIKSEGSTADKMGYFRTSAALLDKIINMQEKMSSLRHYHEFSSQVMFVLEEVCTPAQRTEVIDRLGNLVGKAK